MENIKNIDVCIVGGGVSGLFISSKFLSNDHTVLLIENGDKFGGQLNLYGEKNVYNIPLTDKIKSKDIVKELCDKNLNHKNFNMFLNSHIVAIKKQEDEKFLLEIQNMKTEEKFNFCCKYIVFAYGKGKMEPNKIPLPDAEKFENHTLLYSVAHKDVFKDKDIVIAGGGHSVIDWVCELYDICKTITIIHRRDIDCQENPQILRFKELCNSPKIKLKIPYSISKLNGDNSILSSIDIVNMNDKTIENIKCDYLMPFYGLKTIQPEIEIYKNIGINFNKQVIQVDSSCNETNVKNIFAVGDCCEYEGKVDNIVMGFFDGLKCFNEICKREKGDVRFYVHK